MPEETRTVFARLNPQFGGREFNREVDEATDKLKLLGRAADGMLRSVEGSARGAKTAGESVAQAAEKMWRRWDDAAKQMATYETRIRQLQRVSEGLSFTQLKATLEGINRAARGIPEGMKLGIENLNQLVSGAKSGLSSLQAEALLTSRVIGSMMAESRRAEAEARAALRATIDQNTGANRTNAQLPLSYGPGGTRASQQAAYEELFKPIIAAQDRAAVEAAANSQKLVNSLLGVREFPALAAEARREYEQFWQQVERTAEQGAAKVRAEWVQAFNNRVGIGTTALQGSAAQQARRDNAAAAFGPMLEQDAAGAQRLIQTYDLLGARLKQVKLDQEQLNKAIASGVVPANSASVALANMNRELTTLEAAMLRGDKATYSLYQKQQILQAGLVNTFQSLAAGQGVFSTLFIQSTQLVGAFGEINLRMLAIAAAGAVVTAAGVGMIATIARIGDAAESAKARINAFVQSSEETNRIFDRLQRIGSQTGQGANEAGGLFQRLLVGAEQIGATNEQVLRLVETFQKLGTIGGGTTQEITAGMRQFVQAIGKGRLDGDELRSVFENLPQVARAIGQELGKSTEQLREMGSRGELTANVVFNALLRRSQQIDETFSNMPVTMERAWGQLSSSAETFIQRLNEMLRISNAVAAALAGAAAALGRLTPQTLLEQAQGNLEQQRAQQAEDLRIAGELATRRSALRDEVARGGGRAIAAAMEEQQLALEESQRRARAASLNARLGTGQVTLLDAERRRQEEDEANRELTRQRQAREQEQRRRQEALDAAGASYSGPQNRESINAHFNRAAQVFRQEIAVREAEVAAMEAATQRRNEQRARRGEAPTAEDNAATMATIAARRQLGEVTNRLTLAEQERNRRLEALGASGRRTAAREDARVQALEDAIDRASGRSERSQTSQEVQAYGRIADALQAYEDRANGAAVATETLARARRAQETAMENLADRYQQENRQLELTVQTSEDRNRIARLEAEGTLDATRQIDALTQARQTEQIELQRSNDLRKLYIDLQYAERIGSEELVTSIRQQIEARNALYDRQRAAAADPTNTAEWRQMQKNQENALNNATRAASDFFYDMFEGKTSDIGKALEQTLKRAVADALAEEVIKPLIRPLIQGFVGAGSSGGLLGGIGNLFGFGSGSRPLGFSPQVANIAPGLSGTSTSMPFVSGFDSGRPQQQPSWMPQGVSLDTSTSAYRVANSMPSFSSNYGFFSPGYQMNTGIGMFDRAANYTFGGGAYEGFQSGVQGAQTSTGLGQVSAGQWIGGAAGIIGGGYGIYSGLERGGVGGYTQAVGGAVGAVGGAAGIATAAGFGGVMGGAIAATAAWAPYIAAIIAVVGALLPGQKPSNREGNATLDFGSGNIEIGGQEGGKYSEENRQAAKQIAESIKGFTDNLDKLVGFNVEGKVQVGVGDRDGIYTNIPGQGMGYLPRDEENVQELIRRATWYAIDQAGLQAQAAGNTDVEWIINRRFRETGGTEESIEGTLESLQWYNDVYKKAIETPVKVPEFVTAMGDLDKSWTELIDKARDLYLATDTLSAKWQAARDEMFEDRWNEFTDMQNSYRARSYQATGLGQAGEEWLFQMNANVERREVGKKLQSLDLKPGDSHGVYESTMASLENALAYELQGIRDKYHMANLEPFAQQMFALDRQFESAIRQARELGWATDSLTGQWQKQREELFEQRWFTIHDTATSLQIRKLQTGGLTQAEEEYIFDINAERERRAFREQFQSLDLANHPVYFDLLRQLEETLGMERLEIAKKYATQVVDVTSQMVHNARGLIEQMTWGDLSQMTPEQRYRSGLRSLQTAQSALFTGGATEEEMAEYTRIAQQVLPIFKDFLGVSETYGNITTEIANVLKQVAPESNSAGLVELLNAQNAGLTNVELAILSTGGNSNQLMGAMLEELQRLTAQVQAMLERR